MKLFPNRDTFSRGVTDVVSKLSRVLQTWVIITRECEETEENYC